MSIKSGIVIYDVAKPIYQPYKELENKIEKCYAKRIKIDEENWLYLVFLQENGDDTQSFSYKLNFSYKNIEKELAELFSEFSRND